MIPCGIPYIFSTVECSDNNVLPDGGLQKLSVEIIIGEVISVDTQAKLCVVKDGDSIQYDKLILGTGSLPSVPGWLQGADLENVFTIPKNKTYLDELHQKLDGLRKSYRDWCRVYRRRSFR